MEQHRCHPLRWEQVHRALWPLLRSPTIGLCSGASYEEFLNILRTGIPIKRTRSSVPSCR